MAAVSIRPLTIADRAWVTELLTRRWGAPRVVSRGRVHQADRLPGFVAEAGGEPAGLVTHHLEGDACEIVTLDALREGRGAGTALLAAAIDAARAAGCTRVWLVTTNDNLRALRFYQRRGFAIAAVHRSALDESRRLKPEIPRFGLDGIPLRDEIELEARLDPGAERVVLAEYDPGWPAVFEEEAARIAQALAGLAAGIHHVGSTAVPGLPAKPVVDIMVGLRSLDLAPEHLAAMEALGYEYRGELGIPGRRYFRKRRPRAYHVHAYRPGHPEWERHLLFRDYLRAHPDEAARYAALKRDLAARLGHDRALYTGSKAPFITELLTRAAAWRQRAGQG